MSQEKKIKCEIEVKGKVFVETWSLWNIQIPNELDYFKRKNARSKSWTRQKPKYHLI